MSNDSLNAALGSIRQAARIASFSNWESAPHHLLFWQTESEVPGGIQELSPTTNVPKRRRRLRIDKHLVFRIANEFFGI